MQTIERTTTVPTALPRLRDHLVETPTEQERP